MTKKNTLRNTKPLSLKELEAKKMRKNCRVCIFVKDPEMYKELSKSSYFTPLGKQSLVKFHAKYSEHFGYGPLVNHCKKHHVVDKRVIERELLKETKKTVTTSQLMKTIYEARTAQDAVISAGMQKLEEGELNITADHLLRAAKDKQDGEMKVRDQQLQLAEMVAFFTSGEHQKLNKESVYEPEYKLPNYDPTIPVTENPQAWS